MRIWVAPPPSNSGNEGLGLDPLITKNTIILVVTLTGRGDNPNDNILVIG